MSLMYEVNTLNAAMIQAAEVCRQDMPEGEKVNAVLACFAGMKPVEAELVVHARWARDYYYDESVAPVRKRYVGYSCTACRWRNAVKRPRCPHCGARMDAKEVPEDGEG